jgi:hypothetical protein
MLPKLQQLHNLAFASFFPDNSVIGAHVDPSKVTERVITCGSP